MTDQLKHIQKIRKDFQQSNPRIRDSLLNATQTLARDLYKKDTHFILELIQNAEDNSYDEVKPSLEFILSDTDPLAPGEPHGALIIKNNEIGFNHDNVDAICQVGKTTKSKILGYIGEKGIGFKSVFRITSCPSIFSNGYRFSLPEYDPETGFGFIVPKWIDTVPESLDPKMTTIILPINKPEFQLERIKDMLFDIKPETILFLRKLKTIQISTYLGDKIEVSKDDDEKPLVKLYVKGTKKGEIISEDEEFLIFSQSFKKPDNVAHEKRQGVTESVVTVAILLNSSKGIKGGVFAYLPVYTELNLPLIINADFILTSSREEIQSDLGWNKWLAQCVANVVAQALQELAHRKRISVEFLNELIKGLSFLVEKDDLFTPIKNSMKKVFMECNILPTEDGAYVSAPYALLAHSAELRALLNKDQLEELWGYDGSWEWLSGKITRDRTKDLYDYLTRELKIKEVGPEEFARELTELFLSHQTINWFIQFYNYLTNHESLWRKPYGSWDRSGILRGKPIIRLDKPVNGKILRAPFDQSGYPLVYLPPEHDTNFPVVNREIAADQKARFFLEQKLGLNLPDVVAEVIETIFPKYQLLNNEFITDESYGKDLEVIKRAFSTDSRENREKLLDVAQKTCFIKSKNIVTGQIRFKKPKDVYLWSDEIRVYFQGNKDCYVADPIVQKILGNIVFYLGLSDKVRITCKDPGYRGFVSLIERHGWHVRGLNGFDPDIWIDGLEFALSNPTIERSQFIWNKIAIPYSRCIKGTLEESSRQTFEDSHEEQKISEFGIMLIVKPWLPRPGGDFVKPSELSPDELPEGFIRDEKVADLLGMKNNKVAKLAQEVGISINDLEFIKKHPEEFEKWKKEIVDRNKEIVDRPIEFPSVNVIDKGRRKGKLGIDFSSANKKDVEISERTIRTTRNTIDPTPYLKEAYTNKDGIMFCQICKKEMPFKKRNGEYYFEAVEAFNEDIFPKELEVQYLALCPLCAAKYKEFVKRDNEAVNKLREILLEMTSSDNITSLEAPLQLDDEASLRFVERHLFDMGEILRISEEFQRSSKADTT